ncbi:hypothetical protein J0L31_01185 [Terrisporobacter glycolicus]|nr:hypothetical protein [Terrisporobacter glycolicus]
MEKLWKSTKKITMFLIGMAIIQFGVALFIKTNIGSDPFTVFTQGIANSLNALGMSISTGSANRIILVVLFLTILIVNKSHIKIGTLICVIGIGPIIDMGIYLVSNLQIESYSYIVRMILVAGGCFLIAIGFSILSSTNVGVAPNDIIPFVIKEKINFEYKYIRIVLDALFLAVGYFLGGTVGVGTIIAMFSTGPFIQMCLPYGQKLVDFIVMENLDFSKA